MYVDGDMLPRRFAAALALDGHPAILACNARNLREKPQNAVFGPAARARAALGRYRGPFPLHSGASALYSAAFLLYSGASALYSAALLLCSAASALYGAASPLYSAASARCSAPPALYSAGLPLCSADAAEAVLPRMERASDPEGFWNFTLTRVAATQNVGVAGTTCIAIAGRYAPMLCESPVARGENA